MKREIFKLFLVVLCLSPFSAYSGVGTGWFKINTITVWGGNGQYKIYTDKTSINGLESCTQTDRSIAVSADTVGGDRLLSLAMSAKAADMEVSAWVGGCCLAHNGLTSPCVQTISVR